MKTWICPICGKVFPKMIWIFGANGAAAMHLQAHQIEALTNIVEAMRKLVESEPIYEATLGKHLGRLDDTEAAMATLKKEM